MYTLKIDSKTTPWWNFLGSIKDEDIIGKTANEQLDFINLSLYEYKGECFLTTRLDRISIVHFETEEDYVVFKLRFS